MNERIQELADQAEDYATAEYEKWIPTPDFSGIPHIRKIFNEKFAELIVRECSNVAWQHTPETEELEYSHLIKDKILKRFGVEE